MPEHHVRLAESPTRMLVELVERAMSRKECAEFVGDERASASDLGLLRDLGLVRFDPRDEQWYATADGVAAIQRARGPELQFSDAHQDAFIRGTVAVRAEWPDGTVKVRILPRGFMVTQRHRLDDPRFLAQLVADLEAQTEPEHWCGDEERS